MELGGTAPQPIPPHEPIVEVPPRTTKNRCKIEFCGEVLPVVLPPCSIRVILDPISEALLCRDPTPGHANEPVASLRHRPRQHPEINVQSATTGAGGAPRSSG